MPIRSTNVGALTVKLGMQQRADGIGVAESIKVGGLGEENG